MSKIHFVGVAGIGMSALADIQLAKGNRVTGSDLRPNNLTDDLCRKGAKIYKGHDSSNVPRDVDFVVKSTCIRDNNPELEKARELGARIISRGEMLKILMEESAFSVAVTGTHGKTTTSALIAHIAEHCGKDPTVVVGGEIESFSGNAKFGKSDMIIAEVDESDGYFRKIPSTCAVITNAEREHMEHYGSFEQLLGAYKEFIEGVAPEGFLVFGGEDPVLGELVKSARGAAVSFGLGGGFDVTSLDYDTRRSITGEVIIDGKNRGRVSSTLIGRHNLKNILAAIAVCIKMGLGFDQISRAIGSFRGVKRRFQTVGRVGNIEVIEDYAHHPTELESVIEAAKDYGTGRIISVFQPHRHSRTNDLAEEFLACFDKSDILILTDVYSADEEPAAGIGIRDIYGKIDRSKFEELDFLAKKDIPRHIAGIAKDGDIVLILGAGDIREIAASVVGQIKKNAKR